MVDDGALLAAAAVAPTGPGVYFFLDGDGVLLYVGKAVDVRRRLRQHAKEPITHQGSKYARVARVAWEEVADDDAACAREADLIAALRPAQNASIAADATWTYLVVESTGPALHFTLTSPSEPPSTRASVYGCFPHLGKGQTSRPGISCSDGFTALLRLLWATGRDGLDGRAFPRSISGTSPPFDSTVEVDDRRRASLHRLLAGTGATVLADLSAVVAENVEPYLRPALTRDLLLARRFFDHGPAALRRLRLRHGLATGPLPRAHIEALLRQEVTDAIGPFITAEGSERVRRRRLP